MDRAKLADEIRGAGNAVRFADGPVIGGSWRNGKFRSMHSPRAKIKTPDWKVIRTASTCHTCDAVASKKDRELAQEWADCYQSFARLIWPCINHDPDCIAEPYISVSEQASAWFAKLKSKFEARRKARESGDAASPAAEAKKVSKDGRKTKKSRKRPSGPDMLIQGLMHAFNAAMAGKAARKKAVAKKKPAKKSKAVKKLVKKKPTKNSAAKKGAKRRKR